MDSLKVAGLGGEPVNVDGAALEKLKTSLRGALLFPNDEGYDKARTVWNAMINRKPALVVRCAGVADIRQAVTFAQDRRLLTAVQGGGTTSRAMPYARAACSSICQPCARCGLTRSRPWPMWSRARRWAILTMNARPLGWPHRWASIQQPGLPVSRWAADLAGCHESTE